MVPGSCSVCRPSLTSPVLRGAVRFCVLLSCTPSMGASLVGWMGKGVISRAAGVQSRGKSSSHPHLWPTSPLGTVVLADVSFSSKPRLKLSSPVPSHYLLWSLSLIKGRPETPGTCTSPLPSLVAEAGRQSCAGHRGQWWQQLWAQTELREPPHTGDGGGFFWERSETRKLLEEEAKMNHRLVFNEFTENYCRFQHLFWLDRKRVLQKVQGYRSPLERNAHQALSGSHLWIP